VHILRVEKESAGTTVPKAFEGTAAIVELTPTPPAFVVTYEVFRLTVASILIAR
jgi:hypothetical protein